MNNAPEIPADLGAIPLIVESIEAFQIGDEKEPKKLYRLSIQAVLDSFQLSLLMRKVEGHTIYAETKAPRECMEIPAPNLEP